MANVVNTANTVDTANTAGTANTGKAFLWNWDDAIGDGWHREHTGKACSASENLAGATARNTVEADSAQPEPCNTQRDR